MSTEQAFRDHEDRLAAGPYTLAPEEPCDRCGADLEDTGYRVRHPHGYNVFDIVCEDCCQPAVRCGRCQCFRCECPND